MGTKPSGGPPMKNSPYEKLLEAERFAERCGAERGHWEQVHRLAVCLFDAIEPFTKADETDRFVLECAAILHDIGWCAGQQGHHKQSMKMILEDRTMPLSPSERLWIGLTARYHRKALPKEDHPVYGNLEEKEQKRIDLLAGILRIADGLDCSHQNLIESIRADIEQDHLILGCRCRREAEEEMQAARKKSDLLARALGLSILILQE